MARLTLSKRDLGGTAPNSIIPHPERLCRPGHQHTPQQTLLAGHKIADPVAKGRLVARVVATVHLLVPLPLGRTVCNDLKGHRSYLGQWPGDFWPGRRTFRPARLSMLRAPPMTLCRQPQLPLLLQLGQKLPTGLGFVSTRSGNPAPVLTGGQCQLVQAQTRTSLHHFLDVLDVLDGDFATTGHENWGIRRCCHCCPARLGARAG